MITATPRTTALLDPSLLVHHARPRRRPLLRSARRMVTGALLAFAALASLAGAAYVVLEHIGFAPVLSPSMQPAFGPGDLVLTRAERSSQLHVGQVVVLPLPDAPGQRYVHRITEVERTDGRVLVRTKGDNNPEVDRQRLQVTSAQAPVVVASIPGAGRLALLLRGGALRLGLLLFTGLSGVAAARRILRGGR